MAGEVARPVIVAGVDGSEDSKEALRWAVRQARLTGAEAHAVTAWQVPFTVYLVPSHTEADYQHDAAELLTGCATSLTRADDPTSTNLAERADLIDVAG